VYVSIIAPSGHYRLCPHPEHDFQLHACPDGHWRTLTDVKPHDPNYRLLEKAGLLKLGKDKGRITPVTLTSKGERQIAEIAGTNRVKEKDGTESYTVPIAERKLMEISNITMINPSRATVDFTWQWEPSELGEVFDASGPLVKSFNTWERAPLIEKYGANFYRGNPTRAALTLTRPTMAGRLPVD
jgi:hypothetical protein